MRTSELKRLEEERAAARIADAVWRHRRKRKGWNSGTIRREIESEFWCLGEVYREEDD